MLLSPYDIVYKDNEQVAFPSVLPSRASLLDLFSAHRALLSFILLSLLEADFIFINSLIHYSTTIMKFIYAVFAIFAVVWSVSATPAPHNRYMKRNVPENLIPQFGVTAGVNPAGTADCDGIDGPNGQPIKIPCDCPPPREQFIAVNFTPMLMLCIVLINYT